MGYGVLVKTAGCGLDSRHLLESQSSHVWRQSFFAKLYAKYVNMQAVNLVQFL